MCAECKGIGLSGTSADVPIARYRDKDELFKWSRPVSFTITSSETIRGSESLKDAIPLKFPAAGCNDLVNRLDRQAVLKRPYHTVLAIGRCH
jgi:hypothetical protein